LRGPDATEWPNFTRSHEVESQTRASIKPMNGNSTWDRLAEYVEHQQSGKDVFVIVRSFDTSIDTMFDMWTLPERLATWSPPTGSTMEFKRTDVRVGGSSFYAMTSGEHTMFGLVEYLDIRRPDRIEYVQSFADADGNIARHPMAPTWPEKMRTTVHFAAEGPAQTRVTLRWEVYGAATSDEAATFAGAKAGMMIGWAGSFDKLEATLLGN